VDSTSGCDFLSFLDAYSSFHQIQMSREDRKHTAFVTVDGLYCYIVMPYGLRNALPTFVRAMNKTFCNLVRDIVEVYVDDIVVKTKVGSTLVEDLSLVFDRLCTMCTKLNPEKCIFGILAGKLLGFLVSHRGIEANPAKIKAIEAMRPPGRIKDVQKLTGSLAALSFFILRLAERALPFFKLLRRSGPFSWTEEAEQALQELKRHLTSLPVLVAPEPVRHCFCILLRLRRRSTWCWSPRGRSKLARGTPGSPQPRMVSRTPDTGPRQPHLFLTVRTPDEGVRRSLAPVGTQNHWGPQDLMWWIMVSRTGSPGSGPSKS